MENAAREYAVEDMLNAMRAVMDSGGEFRLMPRGTSMLPYLKEGRDSVALVKLTGRARKHDILLYRRKNGKYVLHRVIKIGKSGYIMCGDNQTTPEPGITDEQIIGVVAAVWHGEKRIETGSVTARIYQALWCIMSLRKSIFFMRRAAGKLKRMIKGINKQSG